MLALRPNCECSNRALSNESIEARICPNCDGELVVRPRRPASKLARFPASTERVFKPEGCGASTSR